MEGAFLFDKEKTYERQWLNDNTTEKMAFDHMLTPDIRRYENVFGSSKYDD